MNDDNKPTIEFEHFVDGVLIESFVKSLTPEMVMGIDEFDEDKSIGIGIMSSFYIEVADDQNMSEEYAKILMFLELYKQHYALKNNIPCDDVSVEFINYGKTQLVYVLTDRVKNERFALLVKQPAVEVGKVLKEAENLKELQRVDKMVVAPVDYFRYRDQELYVTPYINQARCIASDDKWGMYVPEPYYRFESFSEEQKRIVNACMIAKLVVFYDFDRHEGISACKLGGGDFMLPKGWENEHPTVEKTMDSLYLIAAREKVKCSFEEYLQILKREFSRKTIHENQNTLVVNHRGRVAMEMEEIEAGIEFGKRILTQRNAKSKIEKAL